MSYLENLHGGRLVDIEAYTKEKFIDFSANINPYGLDKRIKKEILAGVLDIKNYPSTDYEKISAKLASIHKTKLEYIHLGNGASDILYRLAMLFSLSKKDRLKVLIPAPSFVEYAESYTAFTGVDITYSPIDFSEDKHNALVNMDCIEDKDVIYLCNPNNPNSALFSKEFLLSLAKMCKEKHTFLLVDECFLDFVEDEKAYSMIEQIESNEYLIILRSFTKLFALAGLRFGYMLSSNKEILEKINLSFPTWSINSLAFRAVYKACDIYEETREKVIKLIKKERRYLVAELKKIAFKVYSSEANFILFKISKDIDLYKELYKKGILIRSCKNFKYLDESYYRIAIKLRKENKLLIEAIKECVQ